ncbi:MAG TPA: MarR family transcriptional regulator [Candidatus Dormibacteraeota bacterium]
MTAEDRRGALIARLIELQPLARRRFEAAIPSQLQEMRARLSEEVGNTTVRQLEVLRIIASEGTMAMHQLAARHGVTRSTTTEVVDRLESQGLVERRHDPLDRRSVEVALTERAQTLVAQVRQLQESSLAVVTKAYDDEELATLVRLLEKIVAQEVPEPAAADPTTQASAP